MTRGDGTASGAGGSGRLSRAFGPAGGRRAAWRRRVARRWAAAGLAAAAVSGAIGLLRPAAATPPTRQVVVASHRLAAGAVLTPGDLATRSYPVDLAPGGSRDNPAALVGRSVAGPVGPGEILTDGRLVGTALLAGLPDGTVALPLAASAASTAVVRPGVRVDGFLPGRADPVVRDALVLAVDRIGSDPIGSGQESTRVVLAVSSVQAAAVFGGMDPSGPVTGVTFAAH